MTESANVIYGRLIEAAHISGYAHVRAVDFVEALLDGDEWREVGPGFADVNAFLRSIDLSQFMEERPALVKRIKELQPDASNRAIAGAVGVDESTVRADLGTKKPSAGNPALGPTDVNPDQPKDKPPAGNPAPAPNPEPPPGLAGAEFDWDEDEPEPENQGRLDEPEPEKPKPAHVSHSSGDNEWYTPAEYIKAATAVMGAIDLDPASSEAANEVVGAARFYTEDDDGLTQPWAGRVWMNPPYAQPFVDRFCTRAAREFAAGTVAEACVLVNNGTETNWFQEVAAQSSAICFPRGRVKFWHPSKEATPLQGQAVIYLGPNPAAFRAEFLRFGFVVMR